MNKSRREKIQVLIEQLEEIQCMVAELRDEEAESFENLNEDLKSSKRGQKIEDAVQYLDVAESDIGSVVETLQSAME